MNDYELKCIRTVEYREIVHVVIHGEDFADALMSLEDGEVEFDQFDVIEREEQPLDYKVDMRTVTTL